MSENQATSGFIATTLTSSAHAPLSTAGTSHTLNLPSTNTVMFAPQLRSCPPATGNTPFPFVTPTGQIFLTAPLPVAPALPLSFLNISGVVPQLPSIRNPSLPYGILTAPTSFTNVSLQQQATSNAPSVGLGMETLQSPEILNYVPGCHPALASDKMTVSSVATSSLNRPIPPSSKFAQPSSIPDIGRPHLQKESYSSPNHSVLAKTNQTSASSTPSVIQKISKQQKQGQDHTKENKLSSPSGALKDLLSTSSNHDSLVEQINDEVDLMLFYKCFCASDQSSHLHVEVVPSQGDQSLKWLQVRQKDFHIDPELGPVVVARILVSSNRIVKFQILFPAYKTVYTKLFVVEEVENILSELSTDHVICPGLPGYRDKYTVLGYHPSHVRILETYHIQRYDHEHCPIWHVPSGIFSKRDRTLQNMCKQCKYLQNSVVRLATKACEVDPAERESWTDPSSNRPLAYMSMADREERYRKLRQERNQMLVKLRMYEERLGLSKHGFIREPSVSSPPQSFEL